MTVYQQSRRSSADRVVYKGYLRSDIVSTVIIYTMAMVRRSSSHRYLESDIVSTVIINCGGGAVAHEILVSAQGPLVLGFWVWGPRVWGLGLTISDSLFLRNRKHLTGKFMNERIKFQTQTQQN